MAQVNKLGYTGVRYTNFSVEEIIDSNYPQHTGAILICNHPNSVESYKQMIKIEYNGQIIGSTTKVQYKRITAGSDTGWLNFVTDENFTSYVNNYMSNH